MRHQILSPWNGRQLYECYVHNLEKGVPAIAHFAGWVRDTA